jgi:hypothetical protein
MLGVDLSFLENLRSIWVVIICLELLILECPGLCLVREYVHHFYLCHSVNVMVI